MLTIGTILQYQGDPTDLYEIREENILYSPKHKDTYGGYDFARIQKDLDGGHCIIFSSPDYSPEIY